MEEAIRITMDHDSLVATVGVKDRLSGELRSEEGGTLDGLAGDILARLYSSIVNTASSVAKTEIIVNVELRD